MRIQSLVGEDPLEEGMATCSSFLPEESLGQRSLVGYSPGGRKELLTTEATLTCMQACWVLWLSKPAFSSIH